MTSTRRWCPLFTALTKPSPIGMTLSAVVALALATPAATSAQTPRTLVAVVAHADDETGFAPILARYAREGVAVHLVIVTDGSKGNAHTTIPEGPELAAARAEEARCSAHALGIQPPILMGLPDGELGDYVSDPSLIYRLTALLQGELTRLRPEVILTFGPDGLTGHPDHRLVGALVSQLARAGAPGVPDRIFYSYIPAEGFMSMSPERGVPPFLIPAPRYLNARIAFTERDASAAKTAMSCHRTQYDEAILGRVLPAMFEFWKGTLTLATPISSVATVTDLFR